MLLSLKDILPLLRCPVTQQKLIISTNELVAEGGDSLVYPLLHGFPILIDRESSAIDVNPSNLFSSVVDRGVNGYFKSAINRLVAAPSEGNGKNISMLLDNLNNKDGSERPLVLIIGGGTVGVGMNSFYEDEGVDTIAFDVYGSENVQFVGDAHQIPLDSGLFDLVIVQAVLEHVVDPYRVVGEIYRLLKPSGLVYAETPFLQNVHEGAYDFCRFTESGHRYLFKNFELIDSGYVGGAGTQLMWSLQYFSAGLFRSRFVGRAVKLLFFWLQLLDRFIIEGRNIDSATGVYFMGRSTDEVISERDIVRHYKGAQ